MDPIEALSNYQLSEGSLEPVFPGEEDLLDMETAIANSLSINERLQQYKKENSLLRSKNEDLENYFQVIRKDLQSLSFEMGLLYKEERITSQFLDGRHTEQEFSKSAQFFRIEDKLDHILSRMAMYEKPSLPHQKPMRSKKFEQPTPNLEQEEIREASCDRIDVQPQSEDSQEIFSSLRPLQAEPSKKKEEAKISSELRVSPNKFNSKWQSNFLHSLGGGIFLLKAQNNQLSVITLDAATHKFAFSHKLDMNGVPAFAAANLTPLPSGQASTVVVGGREGHLSVFTWDGGRYILTQRSSITSDSIVAIHDIPVSRVLCLHQSGLISLLSTSTWKLEAVLPSAFCIGQVKSVVKLDEEANFIAYGSKGLQPFRATSQGTVQPGPVYFGNIRVRACLPLSPGILLVWTPGALQLLNLGSGIVFPVRLPIENMVNHESTACELLMAGKGTIVQRDDSSVFFINFKIEELGPVFLNRTMQPVLPYLARQAYSTMAPSSVGDGFLIIGHAQAPSKHQTVVQLVI